MTPEGLPRSMEQSVQQGARNTPQRKTFPISPRRDSTIDAAARQAENPCKKKMKIAPPSPFEAQRLQRLHELGIMDTLPDAAFDAVSTLAAHICETPVALISLVDEDRQWFKSRVGLQATQTAREFAFCAHAILNPSEVMLVEDALEDERFFDNPLVKGEPNIRFYAGAPIVTSDDLALGTVCVIDHVPRRLSDHQKSTLQALATVVLGMVEHSHAVRDAVSDQANHWRQQQTVMQAVGAAGIDLKAYIDRDHTYRYMNRTYLDYWGIGRDQINGMKVSDLLPEDTYKTVIAPHLDLALAGQEARFETVIAFAKAGLRHVQVTYIPDQPDGQSEPVGIVARIHDIEDLKERERQLEATVTLLGQKTLQQQKYFHMLSHDLKEPLNAVRNFIGLIQTEYGERLPLDGQRHLTRVVEGTERMRALIDDLRRFIEIESYEIRTETVDLYEVALQAWLELANLVPPRGTQMDVSALPAVHGSASLLRILFQCLFSNAIRYAREGVALRISVSGGVEDNMLRLRIADNGIGIPAEYHQEIFLPSRRLHSRKISPGSGLGLAMCKRIVEMHGGQITVESVVGAGSTFVVDLPETAPARRG